MHGMDRMGCSGRKGTVVVKPRADPKVMLVGGGELAGAAPAEAERIGGGAEHRQTIAHGVSCGTGWTGGDEPRMGRKTTRRLSGRIGFCRPVLSLFRSRRGPG
jgi:hypothetical protein